MKFTITVTPALGRFDETVAALSKLGAEITNIAMSDTAARVEALKAKTPWSDKFHGNRYTGKLKRSPGGKKSASGDGSIEGSILAFTDPLESYTREQIYNELTPKFHQHQLSNAIRRMVHKGRLLGLSQEGKPEGASE